MDIKSVGLSFLAAVMFSGGALLMKSSEGLHRLWPTVGLVALFAAGAVVNTLVVFRSGNEVGSAYVFIVGCETALAFVLATLVYHERLTAGRFCGVLLVAFGCILLSVSGDQAVDASRSEHVDPQPNMAYSSTSK